MSGHSKWSKVKHQKATTDAVKGQQFTRAARAITIAVKEGGGVGDPKSNFKLRLAIEKAREVNVPKENIQRAIEKGLGKGGESFEQVMYEGYGPSGVAILVEAATDNKQRTVAAVKNFFLRAGYSLTSPGSVAYLFNRMGVCTVAHGQLTFEEIFEYALNCGAIDVVDTLDVIEIYTSASDFFHMRQLLEEKGITVESMHIIMRPTTAISYSDKELNQINSFIEGLESLDDIQAVYTNVL